MTGGGFGHGKHPSERRTGGAQPAEELPDSYALLLASG